MVGEREHIGGRNADLLRDGSVAMLAEHLEVRTLRLFAAPAALALPTRKCGVDDHLGPRSKPCDPFADLKDLAGTVGTQHEREVDLEGERTSRRPEVEVVEGRGPQSHYYLASTRSRVGNLHDPSALDALLIFDRQSLHRLSVAPRR